MATSYLLLFIFIFLCNPQNTYTSTCSLDFSKFPYETPSECLGLTTTSSVSLLTTQPCCHSALESLFKAMAIRANKSRSIFLEINDAQDCISTFQNLHQRTNLSICELKNFISSSTQNLCTKDVDSVINLLGVESYNALLSNCKDLSTGNYTDDACFNCVLSYRESLQALRNNDNSSNGKGCAEALLVSLSSIDVDSSNWIPETFSCLWDEIKSSLDTHGRKKGNLLASKKLLAVLIVAAILVLVAPILYKLTRKQLQNASQKDIENLSGIVLTKTMEDESRGYFNCSDLYIFSQDEISKATNSFGKSNLIGEGIFGKTYVGIMPSGLRVAIKRLSEGIKVQDFVDEVHRKAKIRHPNLVSTVGYCDKGDQCLVYEYCVNGDLTSWLLGDQRAVILTWQQRMQIGIGIAMGLCYLHSNPLEKMCHGDIKLTKILLNEKLEAKISDFIASDCNLKEKNGVEPIMNDVFNFGIVLLQLLTGRKPNSLVQARDAILKGRGISGMADPRLNGAYDSRAFRNVLSMAVLCTNPNEHERPNMEEVLQKLEETQILT